MIDHLDFTASCDCCPRDAQWVQRCHVCKTVALLCSVCRTREVLWMLTHPVSVCENTGVRQAAQVMYTITPIEGTTV